MEKNQTAHHIQANRPPLAGAFEIVWQRVADDPASSRGRILAEFAASLVDGAAFNLAQIEQLPDEADAALCLALFEYCISIGLTEEERRDASTAFRPFVAMCEPGTRH